MAVFDRSEQRIVVRAVFDGPAFAGKTTNLRQLCEFFTTRRRSDLFVPEETEGRTLYFDWMHLDGGLVAGHPLRCQLVSVPGQSLLSPRRWHLLRSADVVVFVCESTPSGVEEGRAMLAALRARLAEGPGPETPIVVQANKQDLAEALPVSAIAAALEVDESAVVVGKAHEGGGVRETVVLAIRAAANRVQAELRAGGTDALAGEAQSGEDLLREMRGSPLLAALADEELVRAVRETRRISQPAGLPPLPSPDVPPNFIWPPGIGRELLRRARCSGEATHRPELASAHGVADGSGRGDVFVVEAGLWCMKTSARRHLPNTDAGLAALRELVARKERLGVLAPGKTVVSLQPDGRGGVWLWTTAPWLTTLRAAMEWSERRGDEDALGDALGAYGRAAMRALALAARDGVVLDVHPSNFARLGERTLYIDDDVESGTALPSIGHALLQRVDEYASWPAAVETYVETVEAEVRLAVKPHDLRTARLDEALDACTPRSASSEAARSRWLTAVRRAVA